MAGDLFHDLPPPSAPQSQQISHSPIIGVSQESSTKPPPPPPPPAAPAPALKSALKRPKPQPQSQPEENAAAPGKRLRFKTTTDASEKQVIEAMQKIASHIKNPPKFSKASKLAIQLIQAGSIKEATSEYFFAVLEAAMFSLTSCNEPSLRADYHELFSAAQDVAECLSKNQQNLLTAWTIRAIWANDLFTDDSFVFSKATGRIKEAISALPVATKEDDMEEAVAFKDETTSEGQVEEESDPFGLDALISNAPAKEEKMNGKKEDEEKKRFLKLQREALLLCLESAAKRYKTPWCQTAIDILAKHASDNISRFTTRQRDAIEKLWASIREQQTRRKQGKSVSGKLDVNAFEWLQEKYAGEKISIRRAVGGSGDRRCQQWLG
ncbi:nucleolar/coiled-body phosphoprotein [Perilla frutescens var. hirtella]|uniref:Nucleolar/coiled-body phosphoprotein n=1 Tax=Perilla frutescens var. hirtella TaxID=608512 RepID=A0AAD4J3H7_PERFH|nr:nucleolar/coiled-body phosphoprotein [Perilla frutescens var. hirtella]